MDTLVRHTLLVCTPRYSICYEFAVVRAAGPYGSAESPVGQSSGHLQRHVLFTKCPSVHRHLSVSLESKAVFAQVLRHLRDRVTAYLFTISLEQIHQNNTILGGTCCPAVGSGSRFFHLSQQTLAPHVPVSVLTFSARLDTNDTVR